MPGSLLHQGAIVLCGHGGTTQPVPVSTRVRVAGQPVLTQAAMFTVTGCGLAASGAAPCASAQFLTGAGRIRSNGVPVLLSDGVSTAVPTGSPLTVVAVQSRVRGV